jgi:putative PIN family toxin of toxin-antitoxin system
MKAKSHKVIFDTNVWISFIIGKRLAGLKDYIVTGRITIVYSRRLLQELSEVTSRPKIKKYFPSNEVEEMIDLIKTIRIEFYKRKLNAQQMVLCKLGRGHKPHPHGGTTINFVPA